MMNVKVEVNNEYALKDLLWGQGYDTFKRVCDEGLGEDLLSHIEELFCDELPDICEINDYLAYELDEDEFIATHTKLDDLLDIDTLMEYASELGYYKAHGTIKEAINIGKSKEIWDYLVDNYSDYNLDDLFSEINCIDLEDI